MSSVRSVFFGDCNADNRVSQFGPSMISSSGLIIGISQQLGEKRPSGASAKTFKIPVIFLLTDSALFLSWLDVCNQHSAI